MPRASTISFRLLPLVLSLGASMLLHGAVVQAWQSWQEGEGAFAVNREAVRVFLADDSPVQDNPVAAVVKDKSKEPRAFGAVPPVPSAVRSAVSESVSKIMEPATRATEVIEPRAGQVAVQQVSLDADSSAVETPISAPAIHDPAFVMGSPQNPTPEYPFVARKFDWEGLVRISVNVAASGQPEQVDVLHSSGHKALDQAALATIRDKWLFQPARNEGVAVSGHVVVPVLFELEE